ncbi:hypothetical protein CHLRE_02g081400v5 [Chlamydomonas reinhardtii]|uniref:Branched-chain-amino-acid aminotransferase n=1 Tax=Chlamydomonas reinhardtii TaxID=3055 RepID=A0A2K3E0J2_CHLRE|nr:uncharacterized protein CHLRE_02g081400v5 [Chlamydomonas reinhardtii]PNW86312.1 hypothetical protein CHLRE_02g081400v5 [Chlamydomonas reinhardtii]
MSPSICRTSCEADPAPAPAPAAGPTLVNGNGASPNGHSAGCSTSGRSAASPVDWSKVRLGVDPAPTMFVANWSAESCCWDGGQLVPYGPLHLLPAAQVLNYGQSIFEGMKAYRQADAPAPVPASAPASIPTSAPSASSAAAPAQAAASTPTDGAAGEQQQQQQHILLFRPEANAARFEAGAARMCMPPVPPEMFLAAVHAVVRANADWVPPSCRGSLYVRPLLLGTGPLLGLCPAPSYTFVVYAVPVGGRAKEGRLTALDFLIHDSLHRAAPRGVGSTKAAGNYSPCLMAQAQARAQGCTDCIYLDARSDTYLEEGSGCNVFATHGRVLTTPPAAGSILPGITRASLLQLAGALGYVVREDNISVEAALAADEMFASGTAMVVQPIGSLTYKGRRVQFTRTSSPAPSPAADTSSGATATANGAAPATANGTAPATANGGSSTSHDAEAPEADGEPTPTSPSRSSSSCASGSSSLDAAGGLLSYGYSTGVVRLSEEQRRALEAAAPPPEPGSLPPGVGPVAQRLYGLLTGIQYGRVADPFGWAVPVDMNGPTEGELHLDRLLPVEEVEAEEEAAEAAPEAGGAKAVKKAGAAAGAGGAKANKPHAVFADPNLE